MTNHNRHTQHAYDDGWSLRCKDNATWLQGFCRRFSDVQMWSDRFHKDLWTRASSRATVKSNLYHLWTGMRLRSEKICVSFPCQRCKMERRQPEELEKNEPIHQAPACNASGFPAHLAFHRPAVPRTAARPQMTHGKKMSLGLFKFKRRKHNMAQPSWPIMLIWATSESSHLSHPVPSDLRFDGNAPAVACAGNAGPSWIQVEHRAPQTTQLGTWSSKFSRSSRSSGWLYWNRTWRQVVSAAAWHVQSETTNQYGKGIGLLRKHWQTYMKYIT